MISGNKNKNNSIKSAKKSLPLALFALLSAAVLTLAPFAAGADTASDIATQKAAKQAELQQLNSQISALNTQIAQKQKQTASLKNEVSLYDTQIQATTLQAQATQTNIDSTNLQIDETKTEIAQKDKDIADEKALLAQLIQSLNEYDNSSGLQLSLGSSSFSDLMDQVQYTESLQSKLYSLLQQIKDLKAKLQQNETDLENSLQQLQQLEQQLTATQESLTAQKQSKVQLLAQTKGQESNYQKLLTSTKSQEDAVNKEIYALDQQVQGKKGFVGLQPVHGILAYPMDGVVTQGYGNTGFTSLGYTFHNGIDFAAPAGSPIYAAADGVVYATGTGQAAYGNWVVMKHDGITSLSGHAIMTLYGHMTKFVVYTGETLKQGDLIGYEGNTGNTTRLLYGPEHGFHLHFTVFDANGFGISAGTETKTYGPYQIPYGYTYNPNDFF